jgi:phosphoglycolate phosphatase
MNHPWQTILFDFDYTLADSSAGVVECINYALNNLGLPPVPAAQACRTIGLSLPNTFVTLAGPEHQAQSDQFVRLFIERADQIMTDRTILFETTRPAIQKLKQKGMQMGIVSTKFKHRIESILRRENMSAYFDLVIGGKDVTRHKPSPEGLNMALEMLNCAPANALYVGDSLTDAETAQRAGVAFVAVLSGTTPQEEFKPYPVEAFLAHVGELPAWLMVLRN